MNTRLESIIAAAKQSWNAEQASGRIRINVTLDTSSRARGADQVLENLRAAVEEKRIVADIGVTGSWGFCWMEPCVTVRTAAGTQTVLYGNVTPDRVDELIAKAAAGQDLREMARGGV